MSSIQAGGLLILDPSDQKVISFDWDADALEAGVQISSSTFTISVIRQTGAQPLTKDSPSILTGNRKTQVRLIATTATEGDRYLVSNAIVTNESPAQTLERQIKVLVQNQ